MSTVSAALLNDVEAITVCITVDNLGASEATCVILVC